jgi:hypothetical protein
MPDTDGMLERKEKDTRRRRKERITIPRGMGVPVKKWKD